MQVFAQADVSMDDVAAGVGFAGWAFAAMSDHALCVPGTGAYPYKGKDNA